MDAKRKKKLNKEYLKARRLVSEKMDSHGCGLSVLRHISVDVEMACRKMDSIRAEVEAAMKVERAWELSNEAAH